MPDLIRQKTENKRIVILGFGREGKSTFGLLRNLFPEKKLAIADASEAIVSDAAVAGDQNVVFITGKGYLDSLHDYDLIVKTPGISLKDHDFPKEKITSQTDLFLHQFAGQVTGITGTKGKSTTSTLIHHIYQYCGQPSVLLGNIGRPSFDHIPEITPDMQIVFEMSSHQLEFVSKSPHIAILLNFYQEHLDAYKSYRDYRLAKWNITKFQHLHDYFIVNDDDPLIREFLEEFPPRAHLLRFSMEHEVANGCYLRDEKIIYCHEGNEMMLLDLTKKRKLQGDHNIRNIMAGMMACVIAGLDPVMIGEAVAGFRGLEHRLEDCGIHRGIRFYNDSIATIPEACIAAVKAVGQVDTLILGGFDRGIDYSELAKFLSESSVTNLIFTGQAGKRIRELIKERPEQKVFMIQKFDDFVEVVKKVMQPGQTCLLSPAAASYDEFPNFEVRGKRFRELISDF